MTELEQIHQALYPLIECLTGDPADTQPAISETENTLAQMLKEARLQERKEVALDNYRGQTFSDSTNWHGKFDKFVENNERALAALSKQKEDI